MNEVLYGGVETGGTKVVCLVGTGPENIVAEARFPTTDPAGTIAAIGRFFDAQPPVRAVGVGAFGPIGVAPHTSGWGVLGATPKVGWPGFPFARELQRRLARPVALDTDVNAAALAEQLWGAGTGSTSLVYLTVGTGIGAGLLIDGRPVHGVLHPEAGHMRVPHDRDLDPFTGACPAHRDCWEGLASGSAMAARWGVPGADLAPDHSGWALEADYLAAGIVNLISVVSPQRIVAGGGVLAHPGLLERVRGRLTELLAGYFGVPAASESMDDYLQSPGLGNRAGALGAVALAQRLGDIG